MYGNDKYIRFFSGASEHESDFEDIQLDKFGADPDYLIPIKKRKYVEKILGRWELVPEVSLISWRVSREMNFI